MNHFYRLSVTPVRGSVVNAAAYVSGQRYRDDRTGLICDHSARRAADRDEVAYVDVRSQALTPLDPQALWNAVTAKNRHPNAVGGRMIVAAFPHILTVEQMIERASNYADALVRRYRVAVQFAVHAPRRNPADEADDQGDVGHEATITNNNWHVHFLLSYCVIDAFGNPGPKQIAIDPVSARCNGLPNFCIVERPAWAAEINEALHTVGDDHYVDHRSLADRGLPDEPTMPLGPQRWALEHQGISTDVGRHNAAVLKRNATRRRRLAELARLQDVKQTLVAASGHPLGRRLPRRAVAQFPWNRRTLGSDCHSTILYVHRRTGVVATRDGGRFVELGRDALLVDNGETGQILALLWQRDRSTSPGTWAMAGPAVLIAQANAFIEDRARSPRKGSSDKVVLIENESLLMISGKLDDYDAAVAKSLRISAAIEQLGARIPSSSDVGRQRQTPEDIDDDEDIVIDEDIGVDEDIDDYDPSVPRM